MNDNILSSGSYAGYILIGAVYLLLPAAFFLWLRKYRAARIYPVIIGAITYFISVKMCDLTVWTFFSAASMTVKYAASFELVAFYEETGRFLAIRYPVSDIRTSGAAFCYGIGHAGMECYMRGIQTLCRLSDNASGLADTGLFISFMSVLSITVAFCVHILLSLFIFHKINDEKRLRWLGAAILLHYMLNGLSKIVSLSGSMFFTRFGEIFFGIGLILIVSKIIDMKSVIDDIKYNTDSQ